MNRTATLSCLLVMALPCMADLWDPTDNTYFGGTPLGEPGPDVRSHGLHTLGLSDRDDWFRYELSAEITYVFETEGDIDTTGDIYAADGDTLLASDDDGGDDLNFLIVHTPETSGFVYLHVQQYEAATTSAYTLHDQSHSSYWWRIATDGPPSRSSHAMVYDEERSVMVLFGGWSAEPLGDTWEFDGDVWTRVETSLRPAARGYHAMAYDGFSGNTLLFGGANNDDTDFEFGDTWEYDGENWALVADEGPSPRYGHAMVYDWANDTVLLFGGLEESVGSFSNETWEWDGMSWRLLTTVGPSGRLGHGMVFDDSSQTVLLYGGSNDDEFFDDTWAWDGQAWTLLVESGPDVPTPGGRTFHSMAYNGDLATTIVFGGFYGSGRHFDTWEWDGEQWFELYEYGPDSRSEAAMEFDWVFGECVLFGGWNDIRDFGDTWVYSIPSEEYSVTVPEEGEVLTWGEATVIEWDILPELDIVSVEISLDDEATWLPIPRLSNILNSGHTGWDVRTADVWTDIKETNAYDNVVLRVGDAQDELFAYSGPFIIVPPTEPEPALTVDAFFDPPAYQSGYPVTVSVLVGLHEGFAPDSLAVEVYLSSGLTPLEIGRQGTWIESARAIRWFLLADFTEPLAFVVEPPIGSERNYVFEGLVTYFDADQVERTVSFRTELEEGCPPHPVDTNGDFVISTSELLSAASDWKRGSESPTTSQLLEAASLWKAGGEYRCEADGDYVSLKNKRKWGGTAAKVHRETVTMKAKRSLSGPDAGPTRTVTLELAGKGTPDSIAVQETIPRGWSVSNISAGGVYDRKSRTIRWFLVGDFGGRLTYDVNGAVSRGRPHGKILYRSGEALRSCKTAVEGGAIPMTKLEKRKTGSHVKKGGGRPASGRNAPIRPSTRGGKVLMP